MHKSTDMEILENDEQKGREKKDRRKIINPNEHEQSIYYTSFSSEQSLDMQVTGLDDIFEDKNGNVILKGIPHRILKNNKELVPLSIESQNPNEIVVLNAILTHRFSVCLHLFFSHLDFDPKSKRFYMEAKKFLGNPKCKLNDITEPYTKLKHIFRNSRDTIDLIKNTYIQVLASNFQKYLLRKDVKNSPQPHLNNLVMFSKD